MRELNRQRPIANSRNKSKSSSSSEPVEKKRRNILDTEFLGRFPDPVFVILLVFGFVSTVAAVIKLAPDPTNGMAWYLVWIAAPTLPTLWSVVSAAGTEREMGPRIALVFGRLIGLPFLLSISMALVGMLVSVLPPVAGQIAAVRAAGVHGAFPAENGPAATMVFIMVGIAGGGVAMLTGLLALVLAVLPLAAVKQPADLAAVALFDVRFFEAPQGVTVGRAFAAVTCNAIVIPTFILLGARKTQAQSYPEAVSNALVIFSSPAQVLGDAMWALGILLVPMAVLQMIVICVRMRQLESV